MKPDFFETRMGRKFYEYDVPKIVKSLKRIADSLEKISDTIEKDEKEPVSDSWKGIKNLI